MKTFKDTAGLEWPVSVNVASIKRVRDMAAVDLLAVADGKMIDRLYQDPISLVDTLWAICQPQIVERQTTPEQFATAIAGDALEDATTALMEDLRDFFPKARRTTMGKALTKIREVDERAHQRAGEKIDAMDVDALLAQSSEPAGSSPGSSASTPTP